MKKLSYSRVLIGGIAIFLGVGLLLEQLNIDQLGNVLSYFWPILFCALGLVMLLGESKRVFWGSLFFLIGLLLLFTRIFNLNFSLWNLWPLVFVLIGISILFPNTKRFINKKYEGFNETSEDSVDINVVFWGDKRKVMSNNFKDGNVTVMFGGSEIDLRDAKFENGKAKLNIVNLFGGTSILVSPNTKVQNEAIGVIGGFEDKHIYANDPKKEQILVITGFCSFGGVEVK